MTDEVKIPLNPSEICYRAFELMKERQFDEAEKLLAFNVSRADDPVAIGLFHSALGVLYKLKGDPKTAWKHYKRAEQCIPEDPALKLVVARLLIDQFAEYDAAIKRAKAILDKMGSNPVFAHQAYTTMGLAYLGKRDEKRAISMLIKSYENGFDNFITVKNIDFKLVEMLLRKKVAIKECADFLKKALEFARRRREGEWVALLDEMLGALKDEIK